MNGLPTIVALLLTMTPIPEATIDKAKIEGMIARLKSPHKAPDPTSSTFGFGSGLANGEDDKSLDPVCEARSQLTLLGKEAFPFLIEHGNDQGYSLSTNWSDPVNYSVGDVCLMIVHDQIDIAHRACKCRNGVDGKTHVRKGYFWRDASDQMDRRTAYKKWWDEHKTCSLKEMQIEAMEWAIEQEKAIGFPSAKDKLEYFAPLQRQLDELKKK